MKDDDLFWYIGDFFEHFPPGHQLTIVAKHAFDREYAVNFGPASGGRGAGGGGHGRWSAAGFSPLGRGQTFPKRRSRLAYASSAAQKSASPKSGQSRSVTTSSA